MQILHWIVTLSALGIAFAAWQMLDHLPTHVYENERIHAAEVWIRSRCAGDSVNVACVHYPNIEKPEAADLFRTP